MADEVKESKVKVVLPWHHRKVTSHKYNHMGSCKDTLIIAGAECKLYYIKRKGKQSKGLYLRYMTELQGLKHANILKM